VPLALTRAIRFPPGTVLRFTPALDPRLLEALRSARPQAAELVAAAGEARITVDSLDERACGLRVAHFQLELVADLAEGFALEITWTAPSGLRPGKFRMEGVAAMLGGASDVFFAQRKGGQNRFLLKLSYEAGGARLYAFPAAFAERIPGALRALLPSQLMLGNLQSCA
jgi:hypothetical protein